MTCAAQRRSDALSGYVRDLAEKAAPTDRRAELLDQYEDQLAERLARLLAAELRRRAEEPSKARADTREHRG